MDDHITLQDRIRANAGLITEHLSGPAGFSLGYDRESIEWLDGFIERQRARDDFDADASAGLSTKIGCFLGEAICSRLNASWDETEYGPGVVFEDGNAAFPLAKAAKHFANGSDDSILSFYDTTLTLFGG